MSVKSVPSTKFQLGNIIITPKVLLSIPQSDINSGINRHRSGDWGDIDNLDYKENELSLEKNLRLWSVYYTALGTRFWIITEADRSRTMVLLPEDY